MKTKCQNEVNKKIFDVLDSDYKGSETLRTNALRGGIEGRKADKDLDSILALFDAASRDDERTLGTRGVLNFLSDLGMQVDSRFSSEIFSVASNMLGHAITAKTAKLNKKLKMIDLQLKKAQLDQKVASKAEEIENTPVGEGKALDRNELLKMLNSKQDDK